MGVRTDDENGTFASVEIRGGGHCRRSGNVAAKNVRSRAGGAAPFSTYYVAIMFTAR